MTSSNHRARQHSLRWMGAIALAASVAACGGGGGDDNPAPTPTQLSGTAAVGAPIAGATVDVRCAGVTANSSASAATVLHATTSATGTWQVDTTGRTLPCAVRVTGGNLPAGQAYHSVALTFGGNTNITPLTDLLIANAAGTMPAAWWSSTDAASLTRLTQAVLDKSLAAMRAALSLSALNKLDPLTASFKAQAKDSIDDMLEALQQALSQANLGLDYAGLLSAAASSSFTLSESFRTALAHAYASVTGGTGNNNGGGNTGGNTGGNGSTGAYTLTLDVTASGMALAPVVLTNVPKPSTQAEFCGFVNDPSSKLSLTQSVDGATGTVTIQSCTFSGSVGRVSAIMSITSPVALTVPYSVTYTYR